MSDNNGVDGGSLFNIINDARTEQTLTTALIAIEKQLEIANKISVAQVLATLKAGYDTRDAHLLVGKIREELGI